MAGDRNQKIYEDINEVWIIFGFSCTEAMLMDIFNEFLMFSLKQPPYSKMLYFCHLVTSYSTSVNAMAIVLRSLP